MFLSDHTFNQVIRHAPLVSIDLIVVSEKKKILLGKRLNRPAKGFYFVPGGRIFKNEPLNQAFKRLTQGELGQSFEIKDVDFLGAYDHFYNDCVFGENDSTHYVALAYQLDVIDDLDMLPLNEQHGEYEWFDLDQASKQSTIHTHTQWYVRDLLNNFSG
jgi:colanic acid biosynthesis protein WcaH